LDMSILICYVLALAGLMNRMFGLTLPLNDAAMMHGGESDFREDRRQV
jgi:hypothetical protein